MRTSLKLLGLSALFITQQLSAQQQQKPVTLNIGDAAPAMKIDKWLKGKPVNGFEKGKVYVVEFWATWCQPCIAGMPHLSELARQYKGKVNVSGISVMERATTPLTKIQSFVDSMGTKMDYNVGTDADNAMRDNWLNAAGERGIPFAFIIDQQGRVAWGGLPAKLDPILPRVIKGEWDIAAAAMRRKEQQRLAPIDGNMVVNTLNPYMGNPGKPDSALLVIAKILKDEPNLKYFPKLGHFMFWSLIKTNPDEAVRYAKEWFAASEIPQWKTVNDAVHNMASRGVKLPAAAWEIGAESLQAQLDNYPWSMKFPETYKEMSQFYALAGNQAKADEMLRKSETTQPAATSH